MVRAYGGAAREALLKADFADYIEYIQKTVTLGYDEKKQLDYALNKAEGVIDSTEYSEQLVCKISVPKNSFPSFLEHFPLPEED